MPAHAFSPYEVVLAGAIQTTAGTGAAFTTTVTVNEPGLLDMARGAVSYTHLTLPTKRIV